ncbi:MAG TPA: response regulator [Lacisediminihabitans sp.]|uniref:response regulator transcription factor n=1 Tax=Lacisediminihabitans sp. TaxID=2787631 RepID=UPI002ED8257A
MNDVPAVPISVVIADDDPDIRALISIAVRNAGLSLVAAACDGDEAWLSLLEHRPRLAVLDVAMPGMTGLEVCALVRADESLSGMRIVLLSAAADDQARLAGVATGADAYFTKPFSPRDLAARLSDFMSADGVGS